MTEEEAIKGMEMDHGRMGRVVEAGWDQGGSTDDELGRTDHLCYRLGKIHSRKPAVPWEGGSVQCGRRTLAFTELKVPSLPQRGTLAGNDCRGDLL